WTWSFRLEVGGIRGCPPIAWQKRAAFSSRRLRSIPKMSRLWSVWHGSMPVTKTLSLAPNYARAHWVLGIVQMFTNRAAQGIAECEQALTLDRNLARAHAHIGLAKFFLGRGAETEAHINEALRLSPRDTLAPRWMVWVGLAKAQLNADTEAVIWMRRGL